MQTLKIKIRDKDQLAHKAVTLFLFENDFKQKTLIGGILTIIIQLYVYYVIITLLLQMTLYEDPKISNLVSNYEDSEKVVYSNEMGLMMFSF